MVDENDLRNWIENLQVEKINNMIVNADDKDLVKKGIRMYSILAREGIFYVISLNPIINSMKDNICVENSQDALKEVENWIDENIVLKNIENQENEGELEKEKKHVEEKFRYEINLPVYKQKEIRDKYRKNKGISDQVIREFSNKFDCDYSDIILAIPSFSESIVEKVLESNIFIPSSKEIMSSKSNYSKGYMEKNKRNGELDNKVIRYIWTEGRKKLENNQYGMALKILHEAESVAKNEDINDKSDRLNQIQRYLSSIYEDMGNFEKSNYYYDKIKRYYGIARHYVIEGEYNKSIKYYKKDGEDGEFPVNYKHLSRVYFLNEDYNNMLGSYNDMNKQSGRRSSFTKKDTIIAMKGLIELYGRDFDRKNVNDDYPGLLESLLSKWKNIDTLVEKTRTTSSKQLENFVKKSAALDIDTNKIDLSINHRELEDILDKDIKGMLDSFEACEYFEF